MTTAQSINLAASTAGSSLSSSNYPYISNNTFTQYATYNMDPSPADLIFSYLNEDEISKLLDTIKEREASDNGDDYHKILAACLESRHFSEKFLMKYFVNQYSAESDDFKRHHLKGCLFSLHSADIKSGQYSEIKLYLELNDKE